MTTRPNTKPEPRPSPPEPTFAPLTSDEAEVRLRQFEQGDRDARVYRLAYPLIDREERRNGDEVLAALSMHGGSTDILLDVAKHHSSSKMRGKALFWLSQQAGAKVAPALREAIDADPDSKVKEQAVFGISQLPDDQSIPLLAELAKTHRNPAVRKKAVFWLGQKNNPRALAVIEEILK